MSIPKPKKPIAAVPKKAPKKAVPKKSGGAGWGDTDTRDKNGVHTFPGNEKAQAGYNIATQMRKPAAAPPPSLPSFRKANPAKPPPTLPSFNPLYAYREDKKPSKKSFTP